ncbi:DUF6578 domain-containing protein [Actinoplanes sp. NPDC020271]|uniref:DUF6578 domain-containing protein n=1 Tax=Actinoplanes sp. NPDC020271 TaxID=3363896 RepID=UPI00378B3E9D
MDEAVASELRIWVDDWQMQCCGEPFAVGDEVSWTLRAPDTEWLEPVLGKDLAAGIDLAEEHHGGVEETPPTVGTVVAIRAVHCRYGPLAGGAGLGPVAGSGVISTVRSADGWTPDRGDLKFAGYVVEVTCA